MNVDDAEINKFSNLANKWWDRNGPFKPLHDINPLRLNYILEKCHSLEGKKVLDVGCGGGILTEQMALSGAKVKGIDMAEAPLEVAKLHLLESNLAIDYECIAVEDLAKIAPETYDVVTCLEILEHVPDPASIVSACAKLVKVDGQVFLSTINRNPKSYLFAIMGAEYILKLLPKGTHDYHKFIMPYELDSYAREANLSLKNLIGMTYNPISKKI